MISEESCYTEDWSNVLENSALPSQETKVHLKHIQIAIFKYFKLLLFYFILDGFMNKQFGILKLICRFKLIIINKFS